MPKPTHKWSKLKVLIENYADAKVNDSWKGGGDPLSIPVVEAQLKLDKARLDEFIELLKREE